MTDTHISRRQFVASATAAGCCQAIPGACAAMGALVPATLKEFDYGAVELTGGPLKAQYDIIRASYLALDNDRLLKVYRQGAGLPAPGADMGGWYDRDGFVPGHSLGQYISGLARLGRTSGDQACTNKVHELVEGFGATLGRNNRIYPGPNAQNVWPCYILDKHMAGLVDAYTLSGAEQARDLIARVYQGALPYIPERGRDRIGKKDPPYDETYVLPETLFTASALINERALYDRAVAYLLDEDFFDPLARGQDVLPGRHAYSHAIALSSAGKAHLVLGDARYLRAMANAHDLLVATQQYASGGWGPNETFIEPHKGRLYESLQTTEDHFETPCGTYAAIKLARYLLCATGDAQYGDGLERVVYNCLLGAKMPDSNGDYFYYSTYSARARKVFYQKKWPCCSGTLVQGVADFVKNIYFHQDDVLAVNLFTPSRVRWRQGKQTITLSQETEYPLRQTVSLYVKCDDPTSFTLCLRIPSWVEGSCSFEVNGKPKHIETEKGFAVIRKQWKTGDHLKFEIPCEFRRESIDDLHKDTVAMMRGPLLYVERNSNGGATLPSLDNLREVDGLTGVQRLAAGVTSRDFVPFYFIHDESYTTYFEMA